MESVDYRKKVLELIKQAQQKGLIKKYLDFCKTNESKEYALSKKEVMYYMSKKRKQNR